MYIYVQNAYIYIFIFVLVWLKDALIDSKRANKEELLIVIVFLCNNILLLVQGPSGQRPSNWGLWLHGASDFIIEIVLGKPRNGIALISYFTYASSSHKVFKHLYIVYIYIYNIHLFISTYPFWLEICQPVFRSAHCYSNGRFLFGSGC